MSKRYFYTTNYPYRWGSGPKFHVLNNEYGEIASLEEAKELARQHEYKSSSDERCDVSYGVAYTLEEDE